VFSVRHGSKHFLLQLGQRVVKKPETRRRKRIAKIVTKPPSEPSNVPGSGVLPPTSTCITKGLTVKPLLPLPFLERSQPDPEM
jgi:hypothetical protein